MVISSNIAATPSIPAKFLNIDDKELSVVNPAFVAWEQHDQILLSWLLGSMSDFMLTRIIECAHFYLIWEQIQVLIPSLTKSLFPSMFLVLVLFQSFFFVFVSSSSSIGDY